MILLLYLLLFIILSLAFIIIPLGKINFKFIKMRKYIFPCIIMIFLVFIVIFSESSYKSAHKGFMLWANNVFPSLLPFFICIELIKATNIMELIGKILEPLMRPIFKVPRLRCFCYSDGNVFRLSGWCKNCKWLTRK